MYTYLEKGLLQVVFVYRINGDKIETTTIKSELFFYIYFIYRDIIE